MKECEFASYNREDYGCEHYACNGKCYGEEDCEALGMKHYKCFWKNKNPELAIQNAESIDDTEHVEQVELIEQVEKIDKIQFKMPEYMWVQITWGLIQCSKCGSEFPGATKMKKTCPRCRVFWLNGEKKKVSA